MAAATLNIGTQPEKRGKLIFTGHTDIGPRLVITLPLVQIAPTNPLGFISDEYGLIELEGEALADGTGSFGTVLHPDDAMVSPTVEAYYVGTGSVTWTPEATVAIPTPVARDVGNVNVFEFQQNIEFLDHWNHRGGIRKKDFRPVVQQSATVRLTMDEFTAENLRIALMAT
jgi:hypothetical protein